MESKYICLSVSDDHISLSFPRNGSVMVNITFKVFIIMLNLFLYNKMPLAYKNLACTDFTLPSQFPINKIMGAFLKSAQSQKKSLIASTSLER